LAETGLQVGDHPAEGEGEEEKSSGRPGAFDIPEK
jgi:hypothetical protein